MNSDSKLIRRNPATRMRRGVLAGTGLFVLAACAPALGQTPPSDPSPNLGPGFIQVGGQGSVSVPADRVRVAFTVETEAPSAAEATSTNASKMQAVMDAVRSLQLRGLTVETYGYLLRPEYQISPEGTGNRTISGYRALNNIRVTLDDLDATGSVLDQAVEAGANRIANLQFEASDTRAAELEALRRAVENARAQAEAIAQAMGVVLGVALEVQGGANAPGPRPPTGLMMRTSAEATTPVESTDQTVTANVTIRYQIQEGGS